MKPNFETVETMFRPAPFWSLNEKLNTEETVRQVRLMHTAGLGGFFMHARGGLQTPYMGDEWFDNITAAIEAAEELGMEAWAYDENGWPSGFGDGQVNGVGEIFQQKYLRIEQGEKNTPHTIGNVDGYHVYYEVNPFYVDLLDKRVTDLFIEKAYEPYYQRYGNRIVGFFTDEPQLSRCGIPWSLTLPDTYRAEYGQDLIPLLPQLFYKIGDYEQTRLRFWRLVTRQFSESYLKTVYEWCDARGLKLTGHMLLEETPTSQLTCNGAAMPNYEYFHIPGMDWLGRAILPSLTALQVGSVAQQFNKEQVLSESFACSGHGVGFDHLKAMIEWQMARGITRVCPHLEGYTLRGIRKRDHPPAMYYQQPWWEHYPHLCDLLSRTGKLLGEGKVTFDTLLIHTQSTAWVCYDYDKNEGLAEYEQKLMDAVDTLERKHIGFHLGDETILERHGRVEGATLVVGSQTYTRIVLPPHKVLFDNTKKLLDEFVKNGGVVLTPDEIPANDIVDNPNVTFTWRSYGDEKLYFFVNSTPDTQEITVKRGNQRIDTTDGKLYPFDGTYTLHPYESLMVWDDGTPAVKLPPVETPDTVSLAGDWDVVAATENALVLDMCDYYFDDECIEKNGYILNIQERACLLERPVNVRLAFRFSVDTVPETISLVCETPEKYQFRLNGTPLTFTDEGWIFDTSFRKCAIHGVQTGENLLEAEMRFAQSDTVYENIRKSRIFESERNKLTYDTEIEPFYLVGDFGVTMPAPERLSDTAVRATAPFTITALPKTVTLCDLQEQGFPFFAGTLTLARTFTSDTDTAPALRFKKRGTSVIRGKVNDAKESTCMWEPQEIVLNGWHKGENRVTLNLTNDLHNLLGPHHMDAGECLGVGPACFYKEPSVWLSEPFPWNGGYTLTRFGLEQK